MKSACFVVKGLAVLAIVANLAWGFQQGNCPECRYDAQEFQKKMQERQDRLQASPLHQRARAVGGNLQTTRKALPANLYGDLASLMKASDEVLFVQIIRNGCTLSPSGEDPITMYTAFILRKWKGHSFDTITFSVPTGSIAFDRNTFASTAAHGFKTLLNGERHVLFLRFARGEETKLTPALRLTGDALQGAFEVENGRVQPVFFPDLLYKKYRNAAVLGFLDEIKSLAVAQGVYAPAATPTLMPPYKKLPYELADGHLQALHLHLPPYWSTIEEFFQYQQTVPYFQKLRIEWDSLPGRQGPIRTQDVEGVPLSSKFVLLERTRPLKGGAGKSDTMLGGLLVIATDSNGEVRGLKVEGDPREWHSEMLEPGNKLKRFDFIVPKVELYIYLPDDPRIETITIYKPRPKDPLNSGSAIELDQLGTLKLSK